MEEKTYIEVLENQIEKEILVEIFRPKMLRGSSDNLVERYNGKMEGLNLALRLAKEHKEISKNNTIEVPRCFDEWFQEFVAYHKDINSAKIAATNALAKGKFGEFCYGANETIFHTDSPIVVWTGKNTEEAFQAIWQGYSVMKAVYAIKVGKLYVRNDFAEGDMSCTLVRENASTVFKTNDRLKAERIIDIVGGELEICE